MRSRLAVTALPIVAIVVLAGRIAAAFPAPAHAQATAEPVAPRTVVSEILGKKCGACHQGTPGRSLQAPALGGMTVAEIASERTLIDPGNPDDSPLFTVPMLRQGAHAAFGRDGKPEVTADDMASIRAWIESLPRPAARPACKDAPPPSREAVQTQAARHVDSLSAAERRTSRFVTIAHLVGVCAADAALDEHRLAVALALGSVSRSTELAAPEPIDARRLTYRIDLAKLGWSADDWEHLAAGTPRIADWEPATAAFLAESTGSRQPVLMADWLAMRLLDPGTYARLADLPASLPLMLSNLRIDTVGNVARGEARRRHIEPSSATGTPRLVERHAHRRGAVWLAYVLADGGKHSGAADATPPVTDEGDGDGVDAITTYGILPLPNGLPVFIVADRTGRIVTSSGLAAAAGYPAAGSLACAACHASGPLPLARPPSDRPALPAEDALETLAKGDAGSIAGRLGELARSVTGSASPPATDLAAVAPLARLARRGLDLDRAAAELGMAAPALDGKLASLGEAGSRLSHLLHKGRVSRATFEHSLPLLMGAQAAAAQTGTASAPSGASEAPAPTELTAVLSQPRYKVGDLVALTVHTTRSCHITVINVGAGGRATVLLPNDFDRTSFLEAGRTLKLPGEMAAYQFRLTEPGQERIIVLCGDQAPDADGLGHDFERLKFTELGQLDGFLRRLWDGEPVTAKPLIPDSSRPARRPRAAGEATERNGSMARPLAWTGVLVEVTP